jgi:hypothetical protein
MGSVTSKLFGGKGKSGDPTKKKKRGSNFFTRGLNRLRGKGDAAVVPDDEDDGDAAAAGDGDADVEVAAAPSTPRDKVLKRSHAEFVKWFKSEWHYELTQKEFSNLRKAVPGYDAALKRSVDMVWAPEQTRNALVALVDAVHSPAARSRRFLDEVVWPNFWEPWIADVHRQDAARIVTSAVHREVARRRVAALRQAAATESEQIQSAQWLELRLRAEREQVRLAMCRQIAEAMAKDGIRRMQLPTAVLRVQCVWRGHRVRMRMDKYKDWRSRRDQRRLEQERARQAHRMLHDDPYGDCARAQIKRRIWGRSEFVGGGWKPDFTTAEEYKLLDHIDVPPKGHDYGVRTHKVLLPLRSEYAVQKATQDDNTWVGLPVVVTEEEPNSRRLGPKPRVTLGSRPAPTGPPRFNTKYTWIPAKLLKTPLLEREQEKAAAAANVPSLAVSTGGSRDL